MTIPSVTAPLKVRLRHAVHAARTLLITIVALALGASAPLYAPDASAQGVKLNAPCDSLNTLDVTRVDNPQCKAVSAIYLDSDGKMLYSEAFELDNEQLVTGRLVQVVKACNQGDSNCSGSCGKASCFVCLGGRCGCVC